MFRKLTFLGALLTATVTGKVCKVVDNVDYVCCEDPATTIQFTDVSGEWGIENNTWCLFEELNCPAKEQGFTCCKSENPKVEYTDELGDWSIENGQWCNIIPAQPTTTTTVEPVEPTTSVVVEPTTTTVEPVQPTTTTTEPETTTVIEQPTSEYCWAEAYGFPCCKETTIVWSRDEQGSWGYENDSWCGIEDLYEEDKDECWASILDAPCCEGNKVLATDEYGTWGFEFGRWCGIKKAELADPTQDETKNCWSVALGFPCCYGTKVVQEDESGSWGYENGQWCGIPTPAKIKSVFTNVIENGKLNENYKDLSWETTLSFNEEGYLVGSIASGYGAVSLNNISGKPLKNGSLRITIKGPKGAKVSFSVSDLETDTFFELEQIVLSDEFKTYDVDNEHPGYDRINIQDFTGGAIEVVIKEIITSTGPASDFSLNDPVYTTIYTTENEFPAGFQNWSWETTIAYDECMVATINPEAWGAVSIKTEAPLSNGSIRFDIKSSTVGAKVNFAVSSSTTEDWIAIESISATSEWTTYTLDIEAAEFDRINFQDGTNLGMEVSLRNIIYSTGKASEFPSTSEPGNTVETIYGTESRFPLTFDNWSWGAAITYDEAMIVTTEPASNGAVSFKSAVMMAKGAVRFEMKTNLEGAIVNFAVANSGTDDWNTIKAIASTTEWTTYTLDIEVAEFDRINIQDGTTEGGLVISLRNIMYTTGTSADFDKTEEPTPTTTVVEPTVVPTEAPTVAPVYTTIYGTEGEFPDNYQNWGWDTDISFEEDGSMVCTIVGGGWGALSIKNPKDTYSKGSVRFDMKTLEGVNVKFAVADSVADEWIDIEMIPSSTEWTTYTIDVPAETYDRINFQDGTGEGVTIYLRNIIYSTGTAAQFDGEEEKPTTTEAPGPIPTSSAEKLNYVGVNEAGGEFGEGSLPGLYNKHYIYPSTSAIKASIEQGMNVFRLGLRWERFQHELFGELNEFDITSYKEVIDFITENGAVAIIDPHNYARYNGTLIGTEEVPAAAFADFWSKVAEVFKGDEKVWFGLVNEPHDMDTETWFSAARETVDAIRATGAKNRILVAGNGWDGAWSWGSQAWYGDANADVALKYFSSADENILFEVHQYFDEDFSGSHDECVQRPCQNNFKEFVDWLRANNLKGWIGEIGGSLNDECKACVQEVLEYLQENKDIVEGVTWWAAGPWWGHYNYSIEPNAKKEFPEQMTWLKPYLPGPSKLTTVPVYLNKKIYCKECNPTATGGDGSLWGWEDNKSCEIDPATCEVPTEAL